MTYIENVFVCIAAPLLIAMLCIDSRYRAAFGFCFGGNVCVPAFGIFEYFFRTLLWGGLDECDDADCAGR